MKKYVVPFTLISIGLIAADRRIANTLPNTADQSRWSGRVSQVGAWYSIASIGGGSFLLGKFGGNDHLRETGLLSLEALGHAQIAVFALKQATNRERPDQHTSGTGFWKGGTSFPSGHSASAFAVATVFAYEYREHLLVPVASYSLATLVGLSRAGARRHWASDIFVGGSLGFMIGRFTYRKNHNPDLPGSKVSKTDRLAPQFGFAPNGGAALRWEF